jgi:hypothetical protein
MFLLREVEVSFEGYTVWNIRSTAHSDGSPGVLP